VIDTGASDGGVVLEMLYSSRHTINTVCGVALYVVWHCMWCGTVCGVYSSRHTVSTVCGVVL